MRINTIYPSFDGEQNVFGIGHPTIFVRTQGCHLRCYKVTKGELCDTPEALELGKGGKEMTVDEIMQDLQNIRDTCGISKVTLTGGEPLMQSEKELNDFFDALQSARFYCTVETSGTIDISPYIEDRSFLRGKRFPNLYWVLDYKLPSAGLKDKLMAETWKNIHTMRGGDVLKFVIDDRRDYEEAKYVFASTRGKAECLFAFGLTWGSKVHNTELFKWMVEDCLLVHNIVKMNFQAHKLIMKPDFTAEIPKEL